ncbi:MAG: MFS transporter [Clostridia bacterium]|nr:MFS transporter [Clostridia bacterium]
MKKEKKVNANELISPEDRIPGKEKLFYGIGAFMDGGGVALMSCVMLKYMTTFGIAMAVASTIMMIAKIWDAITDPLMGFITDNSRFKSGRRKPYLIGGGIAVLIAMAILFAPVSNNMSTAGFTAYILIFYIVWNTASTVTQVPYCPLSSDISASYKERNNANTVKLVFSAIASGLAYVLPLVFIEALISADGYLGIFPHISPTVFWILMVCIFGVLFGGGLVLCGLFVKERVKTDTPKTKFNLKRFINNYAEPYRNKSYRWHIVMYVTAFMCMDMISALAVYYATDVWHGQKIGSMTMSSLFIIAPLMVAAVLMFPLARIMMDKKSKQFAFRMGLPFYIAGGIMLAVMDPSWAPPILVPIVALIMGLGFGGAQMMPWIIFPDTVDIDQMATGNRPAGTYSGMMTLARKIGGALAVGIVGWIIGGVGYIENTSGNASTYIEQSDTVLLTIRLVMGICIAVFITIAFIASFKYKVTNKKLERVRYFIEARKNGSVLTPEEEQERTDLVHALYGSKDPGGYANNDIPKDKIIEDNDTENVEITNDDNTNGDE